jgi:hypothetical protein
MVYDLKLSRMVYENTAHSCRYVFQQWRSPTMREKRPESSYREPLRDQSEIHSRVSLLNSVLAFGDRSIFGLI